MTHYTTFSDGWRNPDYDPRETMSLTSGVTEQGPGIGKKKPGLTKEQVVKGQYDKDNEEQMQQVQNIVNNDMSQQEQLAYMAAENNKPVQKLVLKVVRPDQAVEAAAERDDYYIMRVHPYLFGMQLKKKLCKEFDISPMDLVVYYQNTSGWGSKYPQLMTYEDNLHMQAVRTGALIICKRNEYHTPEPKNASSFYYINEHKKIPEEQRYAPGGAPVKLDSIKENVANNSGGYAGDPVSCPCVKIAHWAFADEGKNVKIYIDAEKEPEVVEAVSSPEKSIVPEGAVKADFSDRGFRLVVHGNGKKHLLDFDDLEDEIVPSDCRTRVSAGKRLTITLKKKDVANTWYTLIRHK